MNPEYWQHRHEASQRALTRAPHENCVHAECLELAICVLKAIKWEASSKSAVATVTTALDRIECRLTELEPKEDTK